MDEIATRIERDPRFLTLQRARARLAWGMACAVFAGFYGFILSIAFLPQLVARPIITGSPVTVGIAYGAGLITFCILLTGLYVWYTNRYFDSENRRVVQDAMRGSLK